jgi:hypothetical protein
MRFDHVVFHFGKSLPGASCASLTQIDRRPDGLSGGEAPAASLTQINDGAAALA